MMNVENVFLFTRLYAANLTKTFNIWIHLYKQIFFDKFFGGGAIRSMQKQPSLDDANKAGMAFDAPQIESLVG